MADSYQKSWLVSLLHSFPHLDLRLATIQTTFQPDDPRYRESLIFWAAIPVLWLLVTLLIFLIYFCYRCCQKEPDKKTKSSCLPITMIILGFVSAVAIGAGIYGNETVHRGVGQLATSVNYLRDAINDTRYEMRTFRSSMNKVSTQGIKNLQIVFSSAQVLDSTTKLDLEKKSRTAEQLANGINNTMNDVDHGAHRIDLGTAPINQVASYGLWFWLAHLGLLCWQLLLVFLLFIGIARGSKCSLLAFCAFGIFTLVLCWLAAGFHLGMLVGLADFCDDTTTYFRRIAQSEKDRSLFSYYLTCTKASRHPAIDKFHSAFVHANTINTTVVNAVASAKKGGVEEEHIKLYFKIFRDGLVEVVHSVQKLMTLTECSRTHRDYSTVIHATCGQVLPGIALLLLSSTSVGILFMILVLLASCAWRLYNESPQPAVRKDNDHSKGYYEIDEDDPFLPRTENASPSYYSFTRGRPTPSARDTLPMHRRGSPPPAYNTDAFFRRYATGSNSQASTIDPGYSIRRDYSSESNA